MLEKVDCYIKFKMKKDTKIQLALILKWMETWGTKIKVICKDAKCNKVKKEIPALFNGDAMKLLHDKSSKLNAWKDKKQTKLYL